MLDRHTSLRLLRASCRPVRVGSAFLLSMALACTASAATLHVTNLNDAGAGSLRQAVQAAADGDIVTFDLGGDITLSSMIQIDRSISIEGPLGGPPVRIDGALSTSLFQVGMGRSVALTRLSLLNASNAVRNYGQLTLTQVLVRGNSASMGAGVTGCVDPATQVLNVFDSVFIDNRAQNGGGAIAACGQINISTSTFADNSAIYGGALAVVNTGSVNITNSTFADNTATGFGGAITTDYPGMALTNVTFSGNSAPTGSALMPNNGAVVNVRNTLFSGGSGGGHCGNPVQGASNLNFADPSGANSCGSSVTVIADPQLGALGDNGGPTPTMALAAGSPAIDAGAAAGAPATDQRGVARPQGAGYDIGAYERAAAPPGPGADGVTAVPTLGEWALVALAALLGLAAARRVRRPGATDASHRIGALVVWCAGIAASGAASALTVTHLGDSGPGSLRDAVASTALGGTVDFAPGLTGAIALASGDILINKALTITGPGASTLAVTHNAGRIFRIDATGADVSISGLRLTGTGGPVRANGGAILSISGQLSLDAIHIEGSAVVGDWQGGGIGGAIHSAWSAAGTSLTIRNSTLNSNSATKAGAIHAYQQTLIIENSTIAGNSATDSGGAVSLESSWNGTAFRHVTIHGNSANIGSGVYARQNAYADFVNTIVAQNNDPGPVPNDIDRGGGTMSATGSLFSELNATNDINRPTSITSSAPIPCSMRWPTTAAPRPRCDPRAPAR